ncbi:MAG: PrgI family protein [bacterium]|nr:PrgI family protein [bacterium]
MHYNVPQFIEVEDKIIGPLTMKQFLWLLMGGGIVFILYFTLKFGVWVLASLFIMGIFSALAFFKIYNMPLHAFIGSFMRYSLMPQIFIWQKKAEGPLREVPERVIFEDALRAAIPQKPRPQQGRIRALAWQLDMKGEAEELK